MAASVARITCTEDGLIIDFTELRISGIHSIANGRGCTCTGKLNERSVTKVITNMTAAGVGFHSTHPELRSTLRAYLGIVSVCIVALSV